MPAKRSPLTCYPDEVVDQQFHGTVKPYYVEKNEGVDVSESYVLRELIREKFYDIKNERTRSLTIRRVHEQLMVLSGEISLLRSVEGEGTPRGDLRAQLARIQDKMDYFVDEGLKMFEERLLEIERKLGEEELDVR
jgi:hypothetical protein